MSNIPNLECLSRQYFIQIFVLTFVDSFLRTACILLDFAFVTFYLGRAAYAVKLLIAKQVVLKPFKKLELNVKSNEHPALYEL